MKVIPFPGGQDGVEQASIAELEAALAGSDAPEARAWRELGSDIRALSPPLEESFETALLMRLASPPPEPVPPASNAPPRRAWRWWRRRPLTGRLVSLGGAGVMAALVIAVLIGGPLAGGGSPQLRHEPRALQTVSGAAPTVAVAPAKGPELSAGSAQATQTPLPAPATAGPALQAGSSAGRVQQLGASLTLAGSAEEVQGLADGVSRIVIAEGGYVASSQVQVEHGASNDATLVVSVPSAHLSRTLAALGRLGPVRAETQSLQDITSSYDSARSALSEAIAERAALLRALAHAGTQGEIESLHQRLGIAGGAIERARAAFGRVSSQAANASLEVQVIGEAHPARGGLSVSRGLHDAVRVLTVALAVALIGLAGLVPLLAIGLALGLAARAIRRAARERALGGS